jgi:hypothetical protein
MGNTAEYKMYQWQKRLGSFYGKHSFLFGVSNTALLLFGLALLFAFYPVTREFTIIPLVLAVLLVSLREIIPLSPIPFNTYNVISSGYGRYVTALIASLASLAIALVCGLLVMLSEKMGTVVFFYDWNKEREPESYWDKEMAWTNLFLIVVPVVYVSSLLAYDKASVVPLPMH